MCLSRIKVKSKSPYGIKYSYVPCGHCEECRASTQNQWTARLMSEIEEYHVKRGYNVGFITLTYQDSCLPHIPEAFFKPGEYRKIPCFSYNDIKRFCDTIRNYFQRKRRWRNAFRFFITSEYGEQYKRPHYHGLLLYSNRISPEEMYQIVEDAWCGSSQIIPQPRRKALRRRPLGIVAPFSSFVPRDPQACGRYCAKYVCKDLAFESEIAGKFGHLSRVERNHLRHFMPFHKQSMAFGFDLIKDKSDDELWDLLRDGFQFTGNPKMVELPVYLKNKILFNTRKVYNLRTHRWETRKYYSKFLMENRDRIAAIKVRQSSRLLQRLCDRGYWEQHLVADSDTFTPAGIADGIRSAVEIVGVDELAWFHAMYYGVLAERCHSANSDGDWLVARYDPIADFSEFPQMDPVYHSAMTGLLDYIFGYRQIIQSESRTEQDELVSQIRAYFNNQMR